MNEYNKLSTAYLDNTKPTTAIENYNSPTYSFQMVLQTDLNSKAVLEPNWRVVDYEWTGKQEASGYFLGNLRVVPYIPFNLKYEDKNKTACPVDTRTWAEWNLWGLNQSQGERQMIDRTSANKPYKTYIPHGTKMSANATKCKEPGGYWECKVTFDKLSPGKLKFLCKYIPETYVVSTDIFGQKTYSNVPQTPTTDLKSASSKEHVTWNPYFYPDTPVFSYNNKTKNLVFSVKFLETRAGKPKVTEQIIDIAIDHPLYQRLLNHKLKDIPWPPYRKS